MIECRAVRPAFVWQCGRCVPCRSMSEEASSTSDRIVQMVQGSWKDFTDDKVLKWLKEPSYPSIRCYTLRHLLDGPQADEEVVAAREAILTEGPGAEILARQRPDGSWLEEENAYNPLYKSSVWQLVFLSELGAEGNDERIRRGVDHVLNTMQASDGSFPSLGKYSGNLMCMEGQTIRALLRLGYGGDERVRRGLDFLVATVQAGKHECRYNNDVPCSWGAVKALRALVEVPRNQRSGEIETVIRKTAEFLADGDLANANYPTPKGQISKHWFQLSFPRSYHSDILEAMVALDAAGYAGDERLRPAVEFIADQRKLLKRQGQEPIEAWKSKHVLTGKLLVDLDWRSRGGPSKWITLLALMVLKDWYGSQ